jgi:hypothetical protein
MNGYARSDKAVSQQGVRGYSTVTWFLRVKMANYCRGDIMIIRQKKTFLNTNSLPKQVHSGNGTFSNYPAIFKLVASDLNPFQRFPGKKTTFSKTCSG